MPDIDKGLRYRNYAEELRIIAADTIMAKSRDAFLDAAAAYDRMADSLAPVGRHNEQETAEEARGELPGDWRDFTPHERVTYCRLRARQASNEARSVGANAKPHYFSIAEQWMNLAAEIEQM